MKARIVFVGVLLELAGVSIASAQSLPASSGGGLRHATTGFINQFVGEAASFAALFALIGAALLLVFIIAIIVGGRKVKKILASNHLKIALNEYWTESDNNGGLLKSPKGPSMRLAPIPRVPIDFKKRRKDRETLLGYQKTQVLDFKHIQRTVNGFSWDILLYKTGPLSALLSGFLFLKTKGIEVESNLILQDEGDFEKEHIDFDTILNFLQKTT